MSLAAFIKIALTGATTLPRYARRPTVDYNVKEVLGAHSTETVLAIASEAGINTDDRMASIEALIDFVLAV